MRLPPSHEDIFPLVNAHSMFTFCATYRPVIEPIGPMRPGAPQTVVFEKEMTTLRGKTLC